MKYSSLVLLVCLIGLSVPAASAQAQTRVAHAIALHGEPKYPASFSHFDYVNPAAPKGGSVRLMATGTFDTLNPYTLKGLSPYESPGIYLYGVTELNEPLMVGSSGYAPSGDEAQTAYGLIAETIEYPPDRSWAIFTLRENARFHDGSPITPEDVVFSFYTLTEQGHPVYAQKYIDVERVEKLDPRRVKFTFKGTDPRAMPLRAAELPVMSKAFWTGREFANGLLEPPLGSGPYRIKSFEWGRQVTFERVKDYWGKDLPVNVGRYNFDEVRYDFYRDLIVAFEAFKAGDYDVYIDYTSRNWATAYDFPALDRGHVIKEEMPHQEATGFQAFFFNTRRPLFSDILVRQALGLLFNYEWLNKALFFDAYQRNNTYFPNTELAATGLPDAAELRILEPFREQLPAELFTTPFLSPVNRDSGQARLNRRKAMALLREAGWEVRNTRLVNAATGAPFQFEVLVDEHRAARVISPLQQDLKRAGIVAEIRVVDPTQYQNRLDSFDFDMTMLVLPMSLSPGHDLKEYFHSSNRDVVGVRNYSGVNHPVVDNLVEQVTAARDREQLVATARALDRVLMRQYYTIPQWHNDHHRVAYWNKFGRPRVTPPYAFNFRDWWIDNAKLRTLNGNDKKEHE